MKVVFCYKLSPDSADVKALPSGEITYDKANWIIGDYDLVAAEAARQIAATIDATVTGVSVGNDELKNTRTRKNILARGADDILLVQDPSLDRLDSHQTAELLAKAIKTIDDVELVVCGEGSGDEYARQVGLQLGEILGLPTMNAISKLEKIEGGKLVAERTVGHTVETLEMPVPAVVTVTADICESAIPSMKDILAAGKKPIAELALADLGAVEPASEVIELRAPEAKDRKRVVISGSADDVAAEFVANMDRDGLLKGGQ